MIPIATVRNPGLLALIVDLGRTGFSDIGVPSSSALDRYACQALYSLLGAAGAPVLEITGSRFALQFEADGICAITGARVRAFLDDTPLPPWASFRVTRGSTLRIRDVAEGFRYYVGFAGSLTAARVMGSCATNLECRFGGWNGLPLKSGVVLEVAENPVRETRVIPEALIPPMQPPHKLRVLAGPEAGLFAANCGHFFGDQGIHEPYTVSGNLNRTGIRLEGTPLPFPPAAPKSIISEGIVPGTVQIPGDGLPIIMLHERTIGGYARLAIIARADQDRLAHLKAGDQVLFERITLEAAERLWREKKRRIDELLSPERTPSAV